MSSTSDDATASISHFLARTTGPSATRDAQCGICFETINRWAVSVQHTTADASVVACENSWHFDCMQSWLTKSNTTQCPLCRRECIDKLRLRHYVVNDLQGAYTILNRLQRPSQQTSLDDVYSVFTKTTVFEFDSSLEMLIKHSDLDMHDQAKS